MIFLGRFPLVETDRPDQGWSSHFDNEIGFFQEIFAEKPSPLWVVFRIWMIWLDISLIQSDILVTTGIVWPVSSDKWKRP